MEITLSELCTQIKEKKLTIHTDSRNIERGDIFVALPLAVSSHHGKKFPLPIYIQSAQEKGASYIVLEKEQYQALKHTQIYKENFKYIPVENVRESLGILAQTKYDTAHIPFPIIAITGTNGKTTSSYLLEHIFHELGKNVAMIGTVSYRWDGFYEAAPLTTPDCLHLHKALNKMKQDGVDMLIMEVSSHALDQNRIAGIAFDGVIFTNLTQDHLDYHEDMEHYFQAKKRIFQNTPKADKVMSVFAGDVYGKRILEECANAHAFYLHTEEISQCAINNKTLHAKLIENSTQGLKIEHSYQGKNWCLHSPLVGEHNAWNVIGVECLALQMGAKIEDLQLLQSFQGVPGRLERIGKRIKPRIQDADNNSFSTQEYSTSNSDLDDKQNANKEIIDQNPSFFVDYAHTPDALVKAQNSLRQAGFKRIITLFGCGGDRDKTKRPLMGLAVANASDIVILTSDNPRTENPEQILDDIMPGLVNAKEVHRVLDRKEALHLAVSLAQAGDAVLVAGKGHETYQIIGTEKQHFSDQEILQGLLS